MILTLAQENYFTEAPNSRKFISLCLSSYWKPANLSLAAEWYQTAGFDWSPVVSMAQQDLVSPLMYRCLREASNVPLEVVQGFQADYLWWGQRNLLFFHELRKLLQFLRDNDVPVILLKGVALAEELYGNIALRPLRDLDILVHVEHRFSLVELLQPLNYQIDEIEVHDAATFEYENELKFIKPGSPETYLDLHWSLLDSMYYQHVLDTDWFWKTAVPVRVEDTETSVLGTEAQILHLCSHLVIHHHNKGLLWFHDIALLLQTYKAEINWDLLLEQAVRYDLVWPLQKTIMTVVNEWQVDVSQEVLERLLVLDISKNEQRVLERRQMDTRPVARRFYTDMSEIPGIPSKIRYGLLHFLPSSTYMMHRYDIPHASLLPLYYPYRWLVGLGSVISLFRQKRGF
jgi:hypothetical protein